MITQTQAQDLLDAYRRALERLDTDLAVSLYAEDAEIRDDPFEPPITGSLGIRARWNAMAASRVHVELEIERSWVSGSTVIAAWHGASTTRATGERLRRRGVTTFDLDPAGLIVRERTWAHERTVGVDSTWAPEPAPDSRTGAP